MRSRGRRPEFACDSIDALLEDALVEPLPPARRRGLERRWRQEDAQTQGFERARRGAVRETDDSPLAEAQFCTRTHGCTCSTAQYKCTTETSVRAGEIGCHDTLPQSA